MANTYVNKVQKATGETIIDISDSTAVASDVAQGKYFYLASGEKVQGSATGGGGGTPSVYQDENGYLVLDDEEGAPASDGWQRPSDWPDYSKVSLGTDEVVYFTYDTSAPNPFMYMQFTGSNLSLQRGTLSNGVFTASATIPVTSNSYVTETLTANSGYVVYKLTGTITQIYHTNTAVTINGYRTYSQAQPLVEVYGRLPNTTVLRLRHFKLLSSVTAYSMGSLTTLERFVNETSCENVKLAGVTTALTNLYYVCAQAFSLKWFDLGGITLSPTRIEYAFQSCYALTLINAKFDLSHLNANAQLLNLFSYVNTDLNITDGSSTVTSLNNAFRNSKLKQFNAGDWDLSNLTNLSYTFYCAHLITVLDLSGADLSAVTNTGNMCEGAVNLQKVCLPSTLAIISARSFFNVGPLREVHLAHTTPPTLENVNAFNSLSPNCTIYVPYSADHSILESYQTATNWSTFASQMQEEPQ